MKLGVKARLRRLESRGVVSMGDEIDVDVMVLAAELLTAVVYQRVGMRRIDYAHFRRQLAALETKAGADLARPVCQRARAMCRVTSPTDRDLLESVIAVALAGRDRRER